MLLATITGGILIGYAGLSVINQLLFVVGVLADSGGLGRAVGIIAGITGILFFLLQLPAVTAYVFHLFSPSKYGAMAFAIVLLSVAGVSLVFKIIWVLLPAVQSFSPRFTGASFIGIFGTAYGIPMVPTSTVAVTIMLTILILMIMYAEYIIFPLYLGSVARAVKDRYLGSGCVPALIMACVALGLKIVVLIIMVAASPTTPGGLKAIVIISSLITMIASGLLAGYGLMYMRMAMQAQSSVG
jgi:hypothetical protein